jgi:hypothetical protein
MDDNSMTTTTSDDDRSPGLGRRLATKLLVGAGTVGVALLTTDSFVLAGARQAEHSRKL